MASLIDPEEFFSRIEALMKKVVAEAHLNTPVLDLWKLPANHPLCEKEVANCLSVSSRTLQAWRLRGGGPKYQKLNNRSIRYRVGDIRDFLSAGGGTAAA